MAGTDMAPPFVVRDGQAPGWKRAARPPKIQIPRRISRRTDDSDADSDSSADEASPARPPLRKRKTSTRRQPRQAIGPAPGIGADNTAETIVEILSDSSESSGPDSPDSPATPSIGPPTPQPAPTQVVDPSPLPQLPPPAASAPPAVLPPPPPPILPSPPPPVLLPPPASPSTPPTEPARTPPPLPPIVPDAPSPTPEPIQAPPITLTPIAPPPRITRVPPPALDVSPPRQPSLPINEQNPDVPPVAAPVLPPLEDTTLSLEFPQITTTSDGLPDLVPSTTTTSRTTTAEFSLAPPPRKEVASPFPEISSSETTSSTSTTTTTTRDVSMVTAVPVEGVTDANRSRMDADTEHALIAVGSIGSFIFVCFISFVIWWCVRRARNKRKERQSQLPAKGGLPPPHPSKGTTLIAKMPLFNRFAKARAWQNLDDGQPQAQFNEKPGPRGTLQLDTNFYAPGQKAMSPQSASLQQGLPQVNFHASPITVSPTSTMLARSNTVTAQHGTYQATENGTLNNIIGQYAASPNGDSVGQGFGQVNYGQSGLYAQEQSRQQPNRASMISSLSSGFGDGDIVVPGLRTLVPPPGREGQQSAQNNGGGSRESWLSRGNRETIYTETSEDSPPRFRTVNSWVNQQTGRVKRQQARDEDDVPPVPGLPGSIGAGMPPEPQFTMMMPDGEEPRRPEGYNNAA